jgi:hypothetical protein
MEKRLKILLAEFNTLYSDEARFKFQANWHVFLESLPNDSDRATAARTLMSETLKNLQEYRKDIDDLVENANAQSIDYERFVMPNPYVQKIA